MAVLLKGVLLRCCKHQSFPREAEVKHGRPGYGLGMLVDIIAIGNSRGICIPGCVLAECGLTDQASLRVEDGRIILERPSPRAGWAEAFQSAGEDVPSSFDQDDWQW